jgi:hypothetical protein
VANVIYPPGTVRTLQDAGLVTAPTRAVLKARLGPASIPFAPRFFREQEFIVLRAAGARLVSPGDERPAPDELARCIDDRLADGKGDGWRYDTLPPDGEAYRRGLRGLDEAACAHYGADFARLSGTQQDDVLRTVQRGDAAGETWKTLPAKRFFEELLAELVESYYSHPLAQERIGYVGMADGRGWQRLGLNVLEAWEPAGKEDTP